MTDCRRFLAISLCLAVLAPEPTAMAFRGGGMRGGSRGGFHHHAGNRHGGYRGHQAGNRHGGYRGHHAGYHAGWHGGIHYGYWGGWWHPVGFLVATLAVTAIVVSVSNQQYHYDQGVYYVEVDEGYKVVPAPVGAEVTTLPKNSVQVMVDSETYYYYGGAFYQAIPAAMPTSTTRAWRSCT